MPVPDRLFLTRPEPLLPIEKERETRMKQYLAPDFCIVRVSDEDVLTLSPAGLAEDSIVDRMDFVDIQF